MNAAHKAYVKCVDREMSAYLSSPDPSVTEFCTAQKKEYLLAIQTYFPHQYENILRVDSNCS